MMNMRKIQSRSAMLVAAAAAALIAVTAALGAAVAFSAGPPPPPAVSAVGTHAILTPADQHALSRFTTARLTGAEVIASTDLRAFYRIDNAGGPPCFATGGTGPIAQHFDIIACPSSFPSADHPLLDFTVMHNGAVWRSEGIAADGVAQVGLQTPTGVEDIVNVRSNTYEITTLPSGAVTAVVALDSAGQVIGSIPIDAPGN
jgi:hypothetical protein